MIHSGRGYRTYTIAVSCLAWWVCSCVLAPPRFGEVPAPLDQASEAEYQKVLDRFTDRAEIYNGFDTRLFVAVTYQSSEFREARVNRLARYQALPATERDRKLAVELAELEQGHEVLLGVHVNDPKFDDFDRKDSIWRLSLIAGDREIRPKIVERIGRSNVAMRAFYPYMGDFWVAYKVVFPRLMPDGESATVAPGTQEMKIRLASVFGKADLGVATE